METIEGKLYIESSQTASSLSFVYGNYLTSFPHRCSRPGGIGLLSNCQAQQSAMHYGFDEGPCGKDEE